METLTPSGAGVLLEGADTRDPAFRAELARAVDTYRFAVVRGDLANVEDAVGLLGHFGPINEAETRTAGAVEVDERDDDEVFRSRNALPLHKDGILTGFDVWYVGIYCVDFRAITDGRTIVADATRALEAVPAEHLELLRRHGVEGMAVDATGYYTSEFEGTWYPVPAFRDRPGHAEGLNIGMPHAPEEPPSWRIRIPDIDAALSDEILFGLRATLLSERYAYAHAWREGDMLVLDNYAVLHGREAFEGERRLLANIQALAPA